MSIKGDTLNDNLLSTYVGSSTNSEIEKTSYQAGRIRQANDGNRFYLSIKRINDLALCSFAILLFWPFFVLIAIIIRLTSPGPAIYKQLRVGKDGKFFWIYKFRSMVDGADQLNDSLPPDLREVYKKQRKLSNDPRVTSFGHFIRRSSLDEIPQIFNIFKGDMSIVGPRPMMPEEIRMYGAHFWEYEQCKPGLTGLWQIHCRNRTRMRNRSRLDVCYLKNASLRLDLWIFLQTIRAVVFHKGAC